jgi:L-threonylcarbamoyladenylate synthase
LTPAAPPAGLPKRAGPAPEVLAPTDANLARAARLLRDGQLVAFPTETVYGLGADASQPDAVAGIYRVKGRPADHPLIVHVAGIEQARAWGRWSPSAQRLAQAFWPGPLTLIVPLAAGAPAHACAGQPSIGLRCPSHPVAVGLLQHFAAVGGTGIAAPSANRFGRVSPTRAEHVAEDMGDDAPVILDGGACDVGLESTIIDLSRGRAVLLRPGRIARADLERVLGVPVAERDAAAPRASGTLASHYRPKTPLELVDGELLDTRLRAPELAGHRVGVWSRAAPAVPVAHWQAAPQAVEAYEQELYDTLRAMDRLGLDRLILECPGRGAHWEAVLDRLGRAAAGSR